MATTTLLNPGLDETLQAMGDLKISSYMTGSYTYFGLMTLTPADLAVHRGSPSGINGVIIVRQLKCVRGYKQILIKPTSNPRFEYLITFRQEVCAIQPYTTPLIVLVDNAPPGGFLLDKEMGSLEGSLCGFQSQGFELTSADELFSIVVLGMDIRHWAC